MHLQNRFLKNSQILLLALAIPQFAVACDNDHCSRSSATFYGENVITTALATALNNELSNATDLNQVVQMTREIAQLNILIVQKDDIIKEVKDKIGTLKENSTSKVEYLKLSELLTQSTQSKKDLLDELERVKQAQVALQQKLDAEKLQSSKHISELTTTNQSMGRKVEDLESNIEKLRMSSSKEHSDVLTNINELESLLKISPSNSKTHDTIKFDNVINGVKKIIKDSKEAKSSSMITSQLNTEQLETIANKMKELQSRLKSSLISGSFTEQLYYITSDYKLRNDELKYINQVFKYASKYKNIDVYITGRADPRGTVAFNTKLAANRAKFVERLAISNGIPQSHIHVTSHITNSEINENSELHFFDRNTTVVIKRKTE
ncbi:OmpA family protein [Photobacterium damselae]|uniref:OmpA family protein n=1 Tax=Photobacterium damselae TaxID=38293 RepID=UPI001F2A80CD|nr:OmpA family protein [Photobacterium damselae]UKA04572.1 OmpA family protein [Photobacterium damselae subsp. damselae]